MSNWRRTRDYRVWRAAVVRRDKRCVVCNSIKSRQAHHLRDGSNHPDTRFSIENGVTLCRKCHTLFHCKYKKSFRYKCTEDDYNDFIAIVNYIKELE